MKFIKENYKAILLVLFVIISEAIILPFSNIPHSTVGGYEYSYGDMLYYFFNQLGYISFLPSLFMYKKEKEINSRGIYLGLVVWNAWEMLQEINILFKFNIGFLSKVGVFGNDIIQILFIIFIVLLTFHAHVKWSILRR